MSIKVKVLIGLMFLAIILQTITTVVLVKNLKEAKAELEETAVEEAIEQQVLSEPIGEHTLTFYTHTGNRTASGVYPKAGRTVAVDTRFIPHGTVLYIEGVGIRIAEDTGGDIKGNRLDVFVDTKQEAINKGVKKANVYKLKTP